MHSTSADQPQAAATATAAHVPVRRPASRDAALVHAQAQVRGIEHLHEADVTWRGKLALACSARPSRSTARSRYLT